MNNITFLIAKCMDSSVQKVKAKNIILNKEYPTNKSEYLIRSINDCRLFLQDNISYLIDRNLFIKSYFLLTGKKISNKKAERLVYVYYQYKDEEDFIVELIYELNSVIKYKKVEYALLLLNYFFVRKNGYEIRIPQSKFKELKMMFKDKERISKNIEFIKSVSKKIDRRNKRLSLNKIIKFFNMNKEKIINTYSIKNIFLFGSYAERTNNFYSDLDLLVIFNKEVMSMDAIDLRNKFICFLENKLDIGVDVLLFEDSIKVVPCVINFTQGTFYFYNLRRKKCLLIQIIWLVLSNLL